MDMIRRNDLWDPFRELSALSDRMNRLFGLARASGNGERQELALADWSPACDISETESEFRITAELPNVPREGVLVTLEEGVLTIRGERKQEKEEKGERFHRRELCRGTFVRRFSMPEEADESKIDAKFKDGVLKIMIGKSKVTPKTSTKQIEIH